MKNFTNNFKQFTSRLSARWLIMAFMLLLGTGSAWAATRTFSNGDYIYIKNFKPSGWGDCWIPSNGYAWAHMWGGTAGDKDYLFELVSGTAGSVGAIYRAKITSGGTYTSIIFTRNSTNSGPWNDKWNQTGTITLPSSGDCATSFSSDGTSATWSTYTPPCTPATITWGTISATMTKGSTQTISTTLTSGAGSVTYTSSNPNVITVSGAKLTAVGNGTATITANHTNVESGYCTAQSITKSVTVSTVIPSGTKLYFDFSKATAWGTGHYLSIVAAANSSYTANNSNTSGANSYTPKSDAWVALTYECEGIYSYTTTSDISTGISLWSTNENSYDQVWQTDVILNIKASEFDSAKRCYTLGSTYTTNSDRQTDCFGGSWGSTIPHCCTPPTITLTNNTVTYNGNPQKPTITIEGGATPTTVKYDGTEYTNGPTNAGTYTVTVWANANGDYCELEGDEATSSFTIEQKTPEDTDFTYTASKTYTGSALGADVEWGANTGTGAITTYYKKQGAADNTYTTSAPTAAGTYTIAVTTAAAGNYGAVTKLEIGEFTIDQANQAALTISNDVSTPFCTSSVTLTTSGGSGTGTVSYEITANSAGASINGNTLTAANSGSVTVVATKAADNNYNAATSTGVTFTFNLLSAPTFSESTGLVCKNVSFNLNTLFSRKNGNNGTLEWYKEEDDTKVQDPTNVSISETTQYYAIIKDGSCYSEESSLVTAKINIPTISNVVITKESPTSISVTATITGEDLALGLVEYVFDEKGMDWSFSSSYGGAVVDNKFSCIINNLTEGRAYKIRVGANTGTCDATYVYSDEYQITTDCAIYPAPAITTSDIVCPNTNVTLSNYDNGVANVLWYSDAECNTRVNSAVKVAGETKYYARTQIGSCYSNVATLTLDVVKAPQVPTVTIVEGEVITCNETSIVQQGKIKITNYNANYDYIIGDNDNSPVNVAIENDEAYIYFDFGAAAFTLKAKEKTCGLFSEKSAPFEITESDNAPVITGNTSFQPNGSTTLTSDKGASTTWEALDGGEITSSTTGTSIVFTAEENGTYRVQATYNGCPTIVEIKVQDDLYVWVRRPIKKETAYDQFYHEDQNSEQGGDLFYKEFASLPGDYKQYNQGGKAAEQTCTDKEGYTWYGFVVSKEAIENNYYFTVHAPNDGGEQGDEAKYNGYYTHTYATQLVDMDADLYFVMDETPSNVSRGWNINTPVVVRASGDASFNGNNFADFVPLYVKDANICGKEVVSFEWQKSDSPNGTYTTYKSGEGINNIRTREAGWYRCVVTYGDGKGTATSNAIQVTNAGGTSYSFTSNLPIVMVNTNGVGFPDECTVAGSKYPSAVADDMKAKISVDVIIKKGDEVLYDRKARMNYRGSSSLNFKKKSYAFVSGQDSCVFDKSRHDYVKTKKAKMLNILGLDYAANDKDWVMYAATADPSMIRNRLVFDLYQKMRPNDWGVHSTYVELVVDGEYKGVYVFMDKITANEKRVNIVDGTGFIVKWDKTDIADRYVDGSPETDSDEKTFKTTRTGNKDIPTYGTKVDQLFEIEYPEKEDIVDAGGSWSGTVETIKQRFEDFETALEAKNYEQVRAIIDYDSWADWFILNEFTKNLDAYRASCIFTCKGQGYKIQAVPLWDQELSFNNAAANISGKGANSTSGLLIQNYGVYDDAFPAPFWFIGHTDKNNSSTITGGLLNDPCFVSLVKEKWATYTADGGVLTSAKINDMVDAYKADLGAIGTNTTPIYRENQMIPFNNNTNAGRGATSSCTGSQAIGYFGYGANCGSAVTHDNSITAIKNWIPTRITGLTSALEPLEGEALIFLVSPATQDVTPWQTALVSVQAPSGYTYTIDYSAITAAGGEVKENDNTYSIKLPRPKGWAVGGNGDNTLSIPYQISASIEVDDEGNACGTTSPGGEDTKTATITLKDELEDCDPPVVRD